ncbi:MAG: DUF3619 family protein [Betaproteobacteria bacterium]
MPTPSHQEFRRLLDDGLQSDSGRGLSKSTRDRLLVARRKALHAIPRSSHQLSVASAGEALRIGSGGAAMTIGYAQKAARRLESSTKNSLLGRLERWFGDSSWLERLLAAALVALVLASLQFAMDEAEVQVFMREGETDARLLTDDLPLDAYADRGFAVFLRNVTVHGLDNDGAVVDTASDEAPTEAEESKETSGS